MAKAGTAGHGGHKLEQGRTRASSFHRHAFARIINSARAGVGKLLLAARLRHQAFALGDEIRLQYQYSPVADRPEIDRAQVAAAVHQFKAIHMSIHVPTYGAIAHLPSPNEPRVIVQAKHSRFDERRIQEAHSAALECMVMPGKRCMNTCITQMRDAYLTAPVRA